MAAYILVLALFGAASVYASPQPPTTCIDVDGCTNEAPDELCPNDLSYLRPPNWRQNDTSFWGGVWPKCELARTGPNLIQMNETIYLPCMPKPKWSGINKPIKNAPLRNTFRLGYLDFTGLADINIVVEGSVLPYESKWRCIGIGYFVSKKGTYLPPGGPGVEFIQIMIHTDQPNIRSLAALNKHGFMLVTFFMGMRHPKNEHNRKWDSLLNGFQRIKGAGNVTTINLDSGVQQLFPDGESWKGRFYTLPSTCFLPPCVELIRISYESPIYLSERQIDMIRDIYDENGLKIVDNMRTPHPTVDQNILRSFPMP